VTASSRFAHLHLHTQYSLLDGAIGVRPLMARLRKTGMTAAAMTDHGNLFGVVEFQQAAQEAGIKSIIGCEVYVAQGSRFDRDPETGGFNGINHLILLAMNDIGYRNLVQLVSKGYLEGHYYKPRIDMELLREHSAGLIATSGCLSSMVPSAILKGRTERAWELVESFQRLFGDRYYLELQRHGIPEQDVVNRELMRIHEGLRIPLIATNDCHYLHASDAHSHEALLCVQTGKTLDDPKRFRLQGEGFYVKDPDEMLERFGDVPEALTNTLEVAERCNFVLETGRLKLPEFQLPPGESLDGYLEKMCRRGLAERLTGDPERPLPADAADYEERLRYELDIIERCGYPGYFLIVWDFIRYAREQGIPVGPGRGSSAGSLAAWSLRIVDIDPMAYKIPFERFLNPERVSMPDIDVDFCMNRRAEVIRYVEQKYNGVGDDARRVAGIVTFGTMQAKAALRDVGRVLGMPFADVDRIAKLVPDSLGITLDEALASSRELREMVDKDTHSRELLDLARALEGQIRHPGKHAAGVVIGNRPLLEETPLYRDPRTGEVLTQFDWRCVEKIGLIKFDLLGLRTLTIIDDTVRRIRETSPEHRDFDITQTPHDDPATYALLTRGDTLGVFQVGLSSGGKDLVMKMQPANFRDLIPLLSLQRPGPLQSGMTDDYIERRHGRTRLEYLLPELEEILSETYGVILYQDQVIQVANRLASYSLAEGDLLRRAMGKKNPVEMEAQRIRFLEGCQKNGHPAGVSGQIFDLMYEFSGYGFPKAHSAAYGLITHQTAYLKAHFPAEFIAATMTVEWRDADRLDRYMRDAAARGIEMWAPSANESSAAFTVTSGGSAIRFGLGGIKNVGEGAVEAILEAREAGGPFSSLYEFCERVDTKRVNKRVVESLIRAGAFDFLKATRASLWEALPAATERGQQVQRDRDSGQASLFDLGPRTEPTLPEIPEWPEAERLAGEKETLGFYVTGHPLVEHSETLERFAELTTDRLAERSGRSVRLAGMLTQLATRKTRGGNLMARAIFEDLRGTVDVVIFPKVFDRYAELLRTGEPVLAHGQLSGDSERTELQLEDVMPLADAWQRAVRELRVSVQAERISTEILEHTRRILDLAPGQVPVTLCLALPNGAVAHLELRRHWVAVTPDLVGQLDALYGAKVTECQL
jgi:DNA polymerase-3 subunit alpha